MKIRNDSVHPPMTANLVEALENFRSMRKFSAVDYIDAKVALIEKYTQQYGLTASVLGVSGGIDSAVVLALVARVKDLEVVPVLLPAFTHQGVTGQHSATERGADLCRALGMNPLTIEVEEPANVISDSVMKAFADAGHDYETSAWGTGQLVSYVRTPHLYYLTTVLTDNGKKAFISGTTNYSEGSYLGYIGKASDAMVDVQMISDLYKSEVYAVARELGITDDILKVVPTGDMFDGTSDEDVFGASYDFVELYVEYLCGDPWERKTFEDTLDAESMEYFTKFADKLDAMHRYNKHKYLAGSPAVHLDINSPETHEKFWKKTVWEG
jgi:NAD+ synthetase